MSVVKSSLLRAGPRRVKLLKEIVSYDADVICLQVDWFVWFG
jgi:mRNA deadenylase 3'-5' endonuclease subunit Ccr4